MKIIEEKILKIKLKGGDVDTFKRLITKISEKRIGFGTFQFTADEIIFINEKIKGKFNANK